MYTTCIYCHKPLGANEIIERFPVGRRLAFDASRGRLWVVCRACERWNLSPLETRWEAIEECERAFLATRLRISTDNIGLARLTEGLELVRIGSPERPEFAAWRYGDQFGRRRRRSFLIAGGAVVAIGAVAAGAAATGIGLGGFAGIWGNIPNLIRGMRSVKLKTDDGRRLTVRGTEFPKIRLIAAPHGGPRLQFKHKGRLEEFDDDEALRLAGRLLPAINAAGGSKRTVTDAVGQLEAERGSEAFIERFVASRVRSPRVAALAAVPPIAKLDGPTRLALEMALHEESERRAIEGELDVLLEAWREAEEIAGISDDLLIPPEVERQLGDLKRKADR
jgi:hypothetical protein